MSSSPKSNAFSIASNIVTTCAVLALVVVFVFLAREAQQHGYTLIMRGSGATFFLNTNDN